jgi:hypothetical protein
MLLVATFVAIQVIDIVGILRQDHHGIVGRATASGIVGLGGEMLTASTWRVISSTFLPIPCYPSVQRCLSARHHAGSFLAGRHLSKAADERCLVALSCS